MEHRAAVRRGDRKNGIAVHLQDYNHHVDCEVAWIRVIQLEEDSARITKSRVTILQC